MSALSFDQYLEADDTTLADLKIPRVFPKEFVFTNDITPILFGDPSYPAQLRHGPNPPVILFVRGPATVLTLGIAVVGSRAITELGQRTVPPAVAAAAELQVPVYSGLALGVDSLAHNEALSHGLTTTAVLATYPTAVTPRSNQDLSERILESGGAIVSESLETRPHAGLLHARNRIIAGLSSTLVPAEASLSSGTMTAIAAAIEWARALVVPVPKGKARDLPGAQALLALAGVTKFDRADLKVTNATWERLRHQDYIANAIATSPTELTFFVTLAHRFSPLL
jgi:DNA processing protein